ncbi:hypothetical protein M9435_000684 [Picochlorum sp. BPE23]|nr:hypothetical protein M9435_000684 [Picochlorum sp. BPE23]
MSMLVKKTCVPLTKQHRRGAILLLYSTVLLGCFYAASRYYTTDALYWESRGSPKIEDIVGSNPLVSFDNLISKHAASDSDSPSASSPSFLRGVHVFSDDCPLTFWETFDEEKLKQQLTNAVHDGFNAVILVIPWAGFQVDVRGKLYDPWMYDRLRTALDLIRDSGLYSISRIGYAHNFRPDNTPPSGERCMFTLLQRDEAMPGWSEYVRSLQHIFSLYDTHLFNFISWEDFFCGSYAMRLPKERRAEYGKQSGFGGPIPANDGSDPVDRVHAWYDHISSIWTTLIQYGQESMPRLTMEIRVDSDPVFAGKDNMTWHGYHDAGHVSEDARAGTYFSPYFGQDNKGLAITAKNAIQKLTFMLTEVAENRFGLEKTFLEQFNFVDNTPSFMTSSNYMTEPQVTQFLDKAAPLIRKSTGGYALWAYRNYRETHLYNGNFLRGMLGWNVTHDGGSVHRHGPFIRLQGPLTLTSYQTRLADGGCDGMGNLRHVCFQSYMDPCHDDDVNTHAMDVCLNGQCVHHSPPLKFASESCYSFPSNGSLVFQISFKVMSHCPVDMRHVQFWCHEQDLKVHHADGSPGALLSSIRKLNTELL